MKNLQNVKSSMSGDRHAHRPLTRGHQPGRPSRRESHEETESTPLAGGSKLFANECAGQPSDAQRCRRGWVGQDERPAVPHRAADVRIRADGAWPERCHHCAQELPARG